MTDSPRHEPGVKQRPRPIARFLGEQEAGGGPFAVLGLNPAACTDALVLSALDRQIERIDHHPECDTPEADEVRLALHAAAAQLLDPVVRRHLVAKWTGQSAPAPPPPQHGDHLGPVGADRDPLPVRRRGDAVGMVSRNDFGRNVDADGRRASSYVDPHHSRSRILDTFGKPGQLLTFRVGGADHVDALHRRFLPVVADSGDTSLHIADCIFVRRAYHIDMDVSRQSTDRPSAGKVGPRARTGKLMLQTAMRLMQEGQTPSVSEVAEAAGVSRATAYRYFPTQAALVQAVVDEALGPILSWKSRSTNSERRMADLLDRSMPRIDEFEATFKAALRLSLEQWAKRQAGTLGEEQQFTRGHRVELLKSVLAPLETKLPKRRFDRLAQALSLLFGVEVLIVLKDIWGLDAQEALSVTRWAATALIRVAEEESGS